MAIPGPSLVTSSGEEVKPMASQKPKLSEVPTANRRQPPFKRSLVGTIDLKALHVPQGPKSGINAIIGKWPGNESEEEVLAMLEELS
jgi:hypothetical protein